MERIDQILLVDDDSTTNHHNQKLLLDSGLTNNVKITLNGGHAFLYLNQMYSNPNSNNKLLILLDVHMPIMNGYEFLYSYNKCTSLNKDNIIIAMMTDTPENELLDMKSLGVHYFISKPLGIHQLKNMIKSHESLRIAS